jgi:hypothetical protein
MLEVFFHRHRIWHFPAKRHPLMFRTCLFELFLIVIVLYCRERVCDNATIPQWQKRFNYTFVLYSKSIDTPLRGVVMMLFQHPAIPWGKRNP